MLIDASFILKLILFVLLLALSAFFAGSESALFSLGKLRVRRLRSKSQKTYKAAKTLLDQPTKLISTLLIGNEVVNAAIGIVGTSLVYQVLKPYVSQSWLPFFSVVLVLPVLLIFGEMLPKTYGLKRPEILAGYNAAPLQKFSVLIRPIRDLIVWAPEKLLHLLGQKKQNQDSISEDVFRAMVDTSAQEGVLDTQEQSIIHNVLKLDDIMVNKIMTSKETIAYFYEDTLLSQVFDDLQIHAYSRFPILNRTEQTVSGVLYAKDLLSLENFDESLTAKDIMRKPLFIQPKANALELFTLFKLNKMHFAVVSSAHKQDFLGVVSLEDVLEEIFGDLKDERDLEDEEEQ